MNRAEDCCEFKLLGSRRRGRDGGVIGPSLAMATIGDGALQGVRDLIWPGMLTIPGSFRGRVSSPKPQGRGPEAKPANCPLATFHEEMPQRF